MNGRCESTLINLNYLNTEDLKKIKKRIKEKIFYEEFNKNIPNIINDKILKINFTSHCGEYYKGAKINSTIELTLINNSKIQTGCKYHSYYDTDGSAQNEDANIFRINSNDLEYMANKHPKDGQKGIMMYHNDSGKCIYIDDDKDILDINKEKYFKEFLEHISIKPTKENIKIFTDFLEYIIETVRKRGALKSLSGRNINYTYVK